MSARPRVLFLGSMYAGHATRFLNLREHSRNDDRIDPAYAAVTGWRDGGAIERLPLPRGARGRIRAVAEARAVARLPRPDAIWTVARPELAPHLWAQVGPLRRPLVLDLDWTLEQQEAWAPVYFNRPPKRGARLAAARLQERALWRATSIFTPWSRWAARSLRRHGIDDARIHVLPPGVDLAAWPARPPAPRDDASPLRLLFVGSDFVRKGGDLVVAAVAPLGDRCHLDIVTAADPPRLARNVRLHRATPNSPELRELYARADAFVMPSRAECFGIATVEAMATALPVVVGDTGAARDIVDDGETGWVITPERDAVRAAIERLLACRDALPAMGARARRAVERRFDGRRNDARIVDLLVDLASKRR